MLYLLQYSFGKKYVWIKSWWCKWFPVHSLLLEKIIFWGWRLHNAIRVLKDHSEPRFYTFYASTLPQVNYILCPSPTSLLWFVWFRVFEKNISLWNPGCPKTWCNSVTICQVLGLQACITISSLIPLFFWRRELYCILCRPWTHYVDKDSLHLLISCLHIPSAVL